MGLKEAKVNFIIDVAANLFLARSISLVTIKDIANEAGVGEMTVYRYFAKKTNIVLAVAMKLQNEIALKYFELSTGSSGYQKLSIFYNSYLRIFIDSPRHYQFINEFDAFMLENGDHELLAGYEDALDIYKKSYYEAYELGLKDGSIKENEDIETFYYATTHSLLELCKKLSLASDLLTQDKKIEKHKEIQTLIDIILKSLQNS